MNFTQDDFDNAISGGCAGGAISEFIYHDDINEIHARYEDAILEILNDYNYDAISSDGANARRSYELWTAFEIVASLINSKEDAA